MVQYSLEAVALHPQKGAIKFYIYLVSANCIAAVCYFMIADSNYIYRERKKEIDINIDIDNIYIIY